MLLVASYSPHSRTVKMEAACFFETPSSLRTAWRYNTEYRFLLPPPKTLNNNVAIFSSLLILSVGTCISCTHSARRP